MSNENITENGYLLSICIPTYNKGKFLDASLSRIKREFDTITESVELLISDNCSHDNTPEIVQKYINAGLPIRYVRNQENIGADRNFLQCFRSAQGKYLWLLGDDDYLKEGALRKILDVLKAGTYGLVHLQPMKSKKSSFMTEYHDSEKFLLAVNNWITFISSNIVNTKYVQEVEFEMYIGSYFIQIPLYVTAVLGNCENIIINEQQLDAFIDAHNNSGFNLFDVFINKYLLVWSSFFKQGKISRFHYEMQKYYMYKRSIISSVFKYLIFKIKINFEIKGCWKILFSNYGFYPYFYWGFFTYPISFITRKIKEKL